MFSVVINILLLIYWCFKVVNGNAHSTGEFSVTEDSRNSILQDQHLGVEYSPGIIQLEFEKSKNHTDAVIKVDAVNQVIYVLTLLYNEAGDVNVSSLYSYLMADQQLEKVEILDGHNAIIVTKLFVRPGVAITAPARGKIARSFTNGASWSLDGIWESIKNIFQHSIYKDTYAVLTSEGYLIKLLRNLHIFGFVSSWKANNIKWHPKMRVLYYVEKNFINNKNLRVSYPHGFIGYHVETHVESYGFIENSLWVFKKTAKGGEFLIKINYDTRRGTFPKNLKIIDLILLHTTKRYITLIVKNTTADFYLYSASLTDLLFSRVGASLGMHEINDGDFCVEIETFEAFPGLIFANFKLDDVLYLKYATSVSFNHGVKWTTIRGTSEVEGMACVWPICQLRLNLRCFSGVETSAIIHDTLNPSLMVASGSIYSNEVKDLVFSGLFISVDAGFMWKTAPQNLRKVEIMNGGSLLVGIPSELNSLLYSIDTGRTWIHFDVTIMQSGASVKFSVSLANSLTLHAITFHESEKMWNLLVIDFETIFENNCSESAFELYTPGIHNHSQCFQGRKGVTMRKIPNAACKVNPTMKSIIDPIPCPCTQDDFGCAFGYYSYEGNCYAESGVNPSVSHSNCQIGEFIYYATRIKKVPEDLCSPTTKWRDFTRDICGFTINDMFVSVFVGSQIKYLQYGGESSSRLTRLPIDIKPYGYIKGYDVDLVQRCVYLVNKIGIIQICYGETEVVEKTSSVFLHDSTLLGLTIDRFTHNVFYFNSSVISVIHGITRRRLTLCKTDKEYLAINIVPELGFLLVSLYDRGIGTYYVEFLFMNGTKQSDSISFKNKITLLLFDYMQQHHIVVTERSIYRISADDNSLREDLNIFNSEKQHHNISEIIRAYVAGDEIFFVTKDGIFLNNQLYHISHVSHARFHFRNKIDPGNACRLAYCDIFCLPVSSTDYRCECPNFQTFDHETGQCSCNASDSRCKKCPESEFYCGSGICIDARQRCDGINHCGDNSDESNCTLTCEMDEILCDGDSICVGVANICDKVNDCKDGKDELHCHKVNKCSSSQFMCRDSSCIRKDKHCDNTTDCVDGSDEDTCEGTCKYYESACDDGRCILHSQVCDDVFDCLDLSDERSCRKTNPYQTNASCLIFCNNICIPQQKVCNHITDCPNGEDELDCDHVIGCRQPNIHVCGADFLCIPPSKLCDGFSDCSDESDELSCTIVRKCSVDYNFNCTSTGECIDLNQYCNGIVDCPDSSDESNSCYNNKQIRSISYKDLYEGTVEFTWSVFGYLFRKELFNVSLLSDFPSNGIRNYITDKPSLKIHDLVPCERYTFLVKIFGKNNGRYLKFTYINVPVNVPSKLSFHHENSTLHWKHKMVACFPTIYYVQCNEDSDQVYQNFTESDSIFVPFNKNTYCRVSACPMNVFNVSCTDFSSPFYLITYSYHYIYISALILMAVLLIFLIMLFLIRRRNIFKKTKTYKISSGHAKLSDKRAPLSRIVAEVVYKNE